MIYMKNACFTIELKINVYNYTLPILSKHLTDLSLYHFGFFLMFSGRRNPTAAYHQIASKVDSDDEFSLSDDEKTLFKRPAEIELNLYPETRIRSSKAQTELYCKYLSIFVTVVVLSMSILTVAVFYVKYHGPQDSVNNGTSVADSMAENGTGNATDWVLKLPNKSAYI